MIAIFSRGMIRSIPWLSVLLGDEIRFRPRTADAALNAVAGWGTKPDTAQARDFAARHHLPFWSVEDGFLRSVKPGGAGAPPLSVVIDDLGVYYDASRRSRLDTLIATPLDPEQIARTHDLIKHWRDGRLSKYNHARDPQTLPAAPYVLVVDQTFGDASIRQGLADETCFARMLETALAEHPDRTILLKMHPDVVAGRKRGHFPRDATDLPPRVQLLAEDVHPAVLIANCDALYTVTSQLGFEALIWGKPVRTFGMPFYAGWGLTHDDRAAPAHRRRATLEAVVHAALVSYPRYIDPEAGQRCEVERVMDHLALQRRMRARFSQDVYALGFSPWKKPIVRRFFQGSTVHFVRHAAAVPEAAPLAVWGAQSPTDNTIHLEDGYLRSAGLGVDLVQPLSWVMDRRGMYYDPRCASDLEALLQEQNFDDALLERARRLQTTIVSQRITKYNVGQASWQRPEGVTRVILVPGQVEADASILLGAPQIKTNLELLQAVRAANPDAWVVYKPHPDVMAGMRAGGASHTAMAATCNAVIGDVPMAPLLEQVDEVHTLTSLAGFEALLRGKHVETYGQPFYAGWGLTADRLPTPRRSRQLTLDELVAGSLILYPCYLSRTTGQFTTPERVLAELIQARHPRARPPTGRRLLFRLGYWLLRRQA